MTEYEARGWTRAERVVFAAFNMPVFDVLAPMAGTLSENYINVRGGKETRVPLCDATAGQLTNPGADAPLVEQLQTLAVEEWGKSWRGKWDRNHYGNVEKMEGMQTLEFGRTQVRLWPAVAGSQT